MTYEANDEELARTLVFQPNGLTLQKIPRGAGKTPDYVVLKNETPVAYCELKSPQDEWLDKLLDNAQSESVVGGLRSDPVFNRIRRLSFKASEQFKSINPNRKLPNILCIVNHDDASSIEDLKETYTGFFHASNGMRYQTMPHISGSLDEAKKQIDACIWINAHQSKLEGYMFNQDANPSFISTLCILLGQAISKIQ